MRCSLIITLAVTVSAGATALPVPAAAQVAGVPDISGHWTNVSLTPITRNPRFGTRAVYTPEEVKELEGLLQQEVETANKPVDPDAPVTATSRVRVLPQTSVSGVGTNNVGGYDRFYMDPGSSVTYVRGQPRNSLIATPDGQIPPRKDGTPSPPAGDRADNSDTPVDNPEQRSQGERCILGFGRGSGPPMLPNGMYNNGYHIIQSPDTVMILVEMVHDARLVRLNSTHIPTNIRPYTGDSIGWYEGNTLVVETTNIPPLQQFYGSWRNLKVTERFTPAANNKLLYQFTVEDPDTWSKPWGGEYEFNPLKGQLYEYACHEGNYSLPGMLAGSRRAEREAAQAGKADGAPAAASPR